MNLSEPERNWQNEQHERIRQQDVIAFAELCEEALPHLLAFLMLKFPQVDPHAQETAAIDCLLTYRANPQKYDSAQLSLFAYLRMATGRDVLNALDKSRRREKRLDDIDHPAVQRQMASLEPEPLDDALDEWLAAHTDLTKSEILQALADEIDPLDGEILSLMLNGVRETARFAEVMDISDEDVDTQRQLVKRAKDRLIKKLQRFGQRIGR